MICSPACKRERQRRRLRERYHRLRGENRCVMCEAESDGHAYCAPCRAYEAQRQRSKATA